MEIDDIAVNARGFRRRRGLSQEQVAAAAGFDVSLISSLERGRTVLPSSSLERVAEALGVTASALRRPARPGPSDVDAAS
ncbi:helix-turn-helix domain-containing protein [Aquihabitans sp. G128]|uniref:helix-turn-helix domain-containing protein n=1 Tax=Aquihabitans sp. G128 TaxID=2849779 RepID=UPI001C24C53B|nr:helix-turn-helix transcriptional regulator [Aquihabitans sp. G128]QXC59680.1 helix-turn-helix domain-containing protein [Aquihabitans sp. G128]